MVKHYIICMLVLAGIVGNQTTISAQNSFVYEKGKSFRNIAAYDMENAIDLNQLSTPILYENRVPGGQNTLSYSVVLPPYIRGVFFSRDSRPGDYEWPNNTNRLLPWMFNHLEDITRDDYPGIPSNARPSTLGDALILQLPDGNYLFAKAVSGKNSLSWFQINTDGSLTLYVSTLGEDALSGQLPLLLSQKDSSIYTLLRKSYVSLMTDSDVAALNKRDDKVYFEAFNYLGWCTWEHYHLDIDETKILSDIDAIEASGIPVRYVLIDDGHIASSNRRLTGLQPEQSRFPNGWKTIIERKQKDKIRWMGLWYSLSGYWEGIAPENDFPEKVKKVLYPYNNRLLPGKSPENIQAFYHYYIHTLKEQGFDFLKIDNQAFTLPLYMGSTEVVRQAKDCNLALEEQTYRQQMGLMNCMAQNVLNTDHTLYSAVTRVSIDYKKFDENMAKSHLFQSYTNTLLQGQTVWPDHDMFHSCDSICGSLMARSKAISGGPVYLSDSPKEFVKENILPLIDENGKLFRPSAPAIPTPECILTNPLQSGKAYRVFAPTGKEAVSLICYNLNTNPKYKKVTAIVCPSDYQLRNSFTKEDVPQAQHILLYDWERQTAEELTGNKEIELDGFTDRLFHLCPIRNGWSVVGLQEKYLSPATVEIRSCTPERLVLNAFCPGTLKIWVETDSGQELRSIPVTSAGEISINK
ncbi:MAG: glycoside hydrolase family 36 [Bacteroides sp.]|nr:glycoside hydrolase family 36 [Bacteroides sp.]